MNVVMIHGFLDTGRLFRPMAEALVARGHTCHAPTLHPRDGRTGIPDLSAKLAAYISDHVTRGSPIAIVGFSMGALVARHYLQDLGGARSARAYFSIAGPHRGTLTAFFYPGAATRQMRPGSAFLRLLDAGSAQLGQLPVFTYRTPFDLIVVPSTSSRLRSAPELALRCPVHSLLPSSPRVIAHIAGELDRMDP